jgi:3-oxo-5alpha-steroid 4-dehydrogenase
MSEFANLMFSLVCVLSLCPGCHSREHLTSVPSEQMESTKVIRNSAHQVALDAARESNLLERAAEDREKRAKVSIADASLEAKSAGKVQQPQAGVNENLEVAVVGAGFAGTVAALSIVEKHANARVTIFDIFECGGDSSLSGGVIYAGGGTTVQQNLGVTDAAETMAKYMRTVVGDRFVEDFVAKSRDDFDWLYTKIPDAFNGTVDRKKAVVPTDEVSLYFTGSEQCLRNSTERVPRGHRTVAGSREGGKVLMEKMCALVKSHPRIMLREYTYVEPLASFESKTIYYRALNGFLGAIGRTAVRALRFKTLPLSLQNQAWSAIHAIYMRQEQQTLTASKLVFASGNGHMSKSYDRSAVERSFDFTLPIGTATNSQEPLLPAAQIIDSRAQTWLFLYQSTTALIEGYAVNSEWETFTNLCLYGAQMAADVASQSSDAYIISDQATRANMFADFELDPANLANLLTYLVYTKKVDTEHTVSSESSSLYVNPYARQLESPLSQTPARKFLTPYLGNRGYNTNDAQQVLSSTGMPIPNVYAVGTAAYGPHSDAYVSGLNLASCLYSGRKLHLFD